jgi:hypothetical protein
MKTYLLIILSSVFVLVTFTQCRRCVQNQLQTQSFTPNERTIFPYKTNDLFVFKSLSNGSTYSLKVIDRKNEYSTYYENGPFSSDNNCPGNYYKSEYCKVQFDFYVCSLYQSMSDNFNQKSEKTLDLSFGFPTDPILGFNGNYSFESDSLQNGINNIISYHNSITLGPKTFTNVYELQGDTIGYQNDEYLRIGYYSFQLGFVGFKTDKGAIWYLN